MKFNINNKEINIFYNNTNLDELEVIIINTFDNNIGKSIFEKSNELIKKDYILVSISNFKWNNELTPWKSSALFKGEDDYLGNANNYLSEIEKDIIPQVERFIINNLNKKVKCYSIVGYSLAGLFALYSSFNSNMFKMIGCVSSSFWYPNFLEYVLNNKINSNVEKIYFSLGNKEKLSKNKILSKVEDDTKEIYNFLNKSVNSIYEENEGGHFNNEEERIIKAIKWLLE